MDAAKAKPQGPANPDATSVEIYDQVYHLRGTDPAYIQHLAQIVDSKMRAVASHGGTVDSLRVAVLASLNMADELEMLRARYEAVAGTIAVTENAFRSRSASLSGLLDELLEERDPLEARRAG